MDKDPAFHHQGRSWLLFPQGMEQDPQAGTRSCREHSETPSSSCFTLGWACLGLGIGIFCGVAASIWVATPQGERVHGLIKTLSKQSWREKEVLGTSLLFAAVGIRELGWESH